MRGNSPQVSGWGLAARLGSAVILTAVVQAWFSDGPPPRVCPSTSAAEGAIELRLEPIPGAKMPRSTRYRTAPDGRLFALDTRTLSADSQ